MEDKKDLIEELDMLDIQQQSILQFKDLEQNKWYQVLKCSDLKDGAYGKYFIMNLLDIKEDKNIKAFSITKLVYVKILTGKYIKKHKGLKEKKNNPGEFYHDISIIDI